MCIEGVFLGHTVAFDPSTPGCNRVATRGLFMLKPFPGLTFMLYSTHKLEIIPNHVVASLLPMPFLKLEDVCIE